MKVEYKGGNREFNSKKLVITTNIEPMNWYPGKDEEGFSMLKRRLDNFAKIYDFADAGYNGMDFDDIAFQERVIEIDRTVGPEFNQDPDIWNTN